MQISVTDFTRNFCLFAAASRQLEFESTQPKHKFFTNRAQKIVNLARKEAKESHRGYVGSEDLLVGLMKEGSGVAGHALKDCGLKLQRVYEEIDQLAPTVQVMQSLEYPEYNEDVKQVIRDAEHEMIELRDGHIGTEHLLLGLIRQENTLACQIIKMSGVSLKDLREEVLILIDKLPAPISI